MGQAAFPWSLSGTSSMLVYLGVLEGFVTAVLGTEATAYETACEPVNGHPLRIKSLKTDLL